MEVEETKMKTKVKKHPFKHKEKDVQRAILDYLAARHIFHYRNNSGGFIDKEKHFYRFGALGSPDIVAVMCGRYVGIEAKGTGGKQSEHQKKFQEELERVGGSYVLCYSLDDFLRFERGHLKRMSEKTSAL